MNHMTKTEMMQHEGKLRKLSKLCGKKVQFWSYTETKKGRLSLEVVDDFGYEANCHDYFVVVATGEKVWTRNLFNSFYHC